MNKKGTTMVEIIVSIALISIVLIFLMNLFITLRQVYNQSKFQADFYMLDSNIIGVVSDDIDNFGLHEINYGANANEIVLTFNTFRPTKLSERIKKVLKVYTKYNPKSDSDRYYIEYTYDSSLTNLTSTERTTSTTRIAPEEAIFGTINLEKNNLGEKTLAKISIPIRDKSDNMYDIHIYGILK